MRATSLFVFIFIALCATGSYTDTEAPLLTVTIQGSRVDYDHITGLVAVQGDVAITAYTDEPGAFTVAMIAEQVEASLQTGHIIAHKGVRLRSQQFALRGEKVEYHVDRDEFVMDEGAVSVDIPLERWPEHVMRGFFTGREMGKIGDVIYVIEGLVTTCDRSHPHFSLGASRIEYDTRTEVLTVKSGKVRLYGITIPIPMSYSFRLGKEGVAEEGLRLPIPGYSSYDGLYFPYGISFSDPEDSWQISAAMNIGTRKRFPGSIRAVREDDRSTTRFTLSRKENTTWDLNRRARLHRLPELTHTRHLLPSGSGNTGLDLTVGLGRFSERYADDPRNRADRAHISLDYSPWLRQRKQREGGWLALTADQYFYDNGQRLRDVQLEAGYGLPFGQGGRAALWGVRHFASGESPFLFDDVYVKNELFGLLETPIGRDYSLGALGRYDLDRSDLRDYSIRLGKRHHCLTWNIEYHKAFGGFKFGIGLPGLTDSTPPYESQPLVGPDETPPLPGMIF